MNFIFVRIGLIVLIAVLKVSVSDAQTLKDKLFSKSRVGLGGEDYRWDVQWIESAGDFGPGDYGRRLKVDGRERYYQFRIPTGYTPDTPTPVVLVFHGGGGYPGAVRYQTDFDRLGDEKGFIAVFPAGSHRLFKDRLLSWNDGRTHIKDREFNKINDVKFVSALLDDLGKLFNVDQRRIYATGISNGGHMTYRLGAELSDRIAAIAPVAASRIVGEYGQNPRRPISMIHVHGKLDHWDPYDGGYPPSSSFKEPVPAVEADVASWVKFNQCPEKPKEVSKQGRATIKTYSPCRNHEEVVFVAVDDGGHTWPGGKMTKSEVSLGIGPIDQDINAMEMIWDFFKNHLKQE